MKSSHFLGENFVEDAHSVHQDHEVQMAREELYHAAESALRLHKLLRNVDESQGLEGWVSSKITLANDYLRTVLDYMEYELMTGMEPTQTELAIAESKLSKIAERNGYNPSTEPDTPEQAARRQQSLQAYQAQQQAPKPPMPEDEYQRRLQQYKIGGRGAGYGFQPRPEDAAAAEAQRAKIFPPATPQQSTTKVNEQKNAEDNPVANAITRRIMIQRLDLLQKYGPTYVMQAIDDVSDNVGTVEEIGNSEVSDWVRQVEKNLKDNLNQYDEPMQDIDKLQEMSAGSVATVVNPTAKNKAKVGTLFGGTYQQKKPKAKK